RGEGRGEGPLPGRGPEGHPPPPALHVARAARPGDAVRAGEGGRGLRDAGRVPRPPLPVVAIPPDRRGERPSALAHRPGRIRPRGDPGAGGVPADRRGLLLLAGEARDPPLGVRAAPPRPSPALGRPARRRRGPPARPVAPGGEGIRRADLRT